MAKFWSGKYSNKFTVKYRFFPTNYKAIISLVFPNSAVALLNAKIIYLFTCDAIFWVNAQWLMKNDGQSIGSSVVGAIARSWQS